MTSQRQLILRVLETLDSHPSAEELYEIARQQDVSLNLSTVYRTLRWLEQEGLIRSRWFENSDRLPRGSRFDKAQPVEHHHFVCTVCGTVIEFDTQNAEKIKLEFEHLYHACIENVSVIVYGLCASCQSTADRNGN